MDLGSKILLPVLEEERATERGEKEEVESVNLLLVRSKPSVAATSTAETTAKTKSPMACGCCSVKVSRGEGEQE